MPISSEVIMDDKIDSFAKKYLADNLNYSITTVRKAFTDNSDLSIVTKEKIYKLYNDYQDNNSKKDNSKRENENAGGSLNTPEASELYKKALKNKKNPTARGMSNRAFLLACRNNLGTLEKGINRKKLIKAIESGDVWKFKQVGESIVKEWCEWVVQKNSMTKS